MPPIAYQVLYTKNIIQILSKETTVHSSSVIYYFDVNFQNPTSCRHHADYFQGNMIPFTLHRLQFHNNYFTFSKSRQTGSKAPYITFSCSCSCSCSSCHSQLLCELDQLAAAAAANRLAALTRVTALRHFALGLQFCLRLGAISDGVLASQGSRRASSTVGQSNESTAARRPMKDLA